MEQKRIEKWDNARGLLIFLVVLGHVIEPGVNSKGYLNWLFLFIYLFHMPAFFFLSGMFAKGTVQNRRFDRIWGYVFLFFAMKIFVFLSKVIAQGKLPGFHVFWEDGIPWYAFCMAVFLLTAILAQNLEKKYVLAGAILLACFAGYDDAVGDALVLSRSICFFPFFFAGLCVAGEDLRKQLSNKWVRIISGVLVLSLLLLIWREIDHVYWIRQLVTGRNPFSRLKRYSEYGALLRLIYYFAAAALGLMVLAVVPEGRSIFAFLGRRSLPIYVFHIPLLNLLNAGQLRDRFVNWKGFPTHLLPCLLLTVLVVGVCAGSVPDRICRAIMNVRCDAGNGSNRLDEKQVS